METAERKTHRDPASAKHDLRVGHRRHQILGVLVKRSKAVPGQDSSIHPTTRSTTFREVYTLLRNPLPLSAYAIEELRLLSSLLMQHRSEVQEEFGARGMTNVMSETEQIAMSMAETGTLLTHKILASRAKIGDKAARLAIQRLFRQGKIKKAPGHGRGYMLV